MMAAFHYLVKVNLYRDQDSKNIDYNDINNIDFIKDERRYEDENPIKAREAAFKFYEEYIEDLLANLKQEVGDDKQIRSALRPYYDLGIKMPIISDILLDASFMNGIGVFMVIDKPIESAEDWEKDSINKELLLHGIGGGCSAMIGNLFIL